MNQLFVLQKAQWKHFVNGSRLLMQKSVYRLISVLFCFVLVWMTLFVIGYLGFSELGKSGLDFLTDSKLGGSILAIAFAALFVMLLFSTGIILFSSLYTTPECAFLLSSPIEADQIFAMKFQTALGFSSWAFVLLGSPVLVAFGMLIDTTPWYYYLLLPIYFLGFVLIPGSVGGLGTLLLVSFFPRHRKQLLVLLGLLVVGALCWWIYFHLLPSARGMLDSGNTVDNFLQEFRIFRLNYSPVQWFSEGLRRTTQGDFFHSIYYLCLIWSNGLMMFLITTWVARKTYRYSYNLLISTSGQKRRKYGRNIPDKLIGLVTRILGAQTSALALKDFRTFRRDPAQWAQIVILIGLILLMFTYVRITYDQQLLEKYRPMMSLLFLSVYCLLICVYTGRFVYPMLSLEGRKFWILGLIPFNRSSILIGKFSFSAAATLIVGEVLAFCSNLVMQMPWPIMIVHALTVAAVALGLSGLSVGMGALTPNFRETDPSKIAVGLGGTVTLMMGFFFLLIELGLMALPWHLVLRSSLEGKIWSPFALGIFVTTTVLGLLLSALLAVIPMWMGTKALEKMEF